MSEKTQSVRMIARCHLKANEILFLRFRCFEDFNTTFPQIAICKSDLSVLVKRNLWKISEICRKNTFLQLDEIVEIILRALKPL